MHYADNIFYSTVNEFFQCCNAAYLALVDWSIRVMQFNWFCHDISAVMSLPIIGTINYAVAISANTEKQPLLISRPNEKEACRCDRAKTKFRISGFSSSQFGIDLVNCLIKKNVQSTNFSAIEGTT